MAQYCDDFKFSENNQDHFVMGPVSNDTFQFWQGLRGPYFTPSVGDDGYLYWTNNGQLPNPEPVRIVGKDGRGITLTGQCETVAELPEDPDQGEAWAVGTEEPFECYAWFGEWVDMGLLFPAGQDGVSPTVTISATATGHKVKITDRDHPSGQEFDVDNGEDGDPGQDGVSPAITITQTSTGHKVKITDRDHPSGQEFNVDDGEDGDPGPGVPPGGSAGQFYRKASSTDYDGEWHTLSAGDSSYDSSLTYASGTVGEELSSQRNTLTQLDDTTEALENGIAYIVDGDNSTTTIPAGSFAYLKNNTHGLPEGLYTNANAPFPSGGGTAADSNIFIASPGALNTLKNSLITWRDETFTNLQPYQSSAGVFYRETPYTPPAGYSVLGVSLTNWSGLNRPVSVYYIGGNLGILTDGALPSTNTISVRFLLLKT